MLTITPTHRFNQMNIDERITTVLVMIRDLAEFTTNDKLVTVHEANIVKDYDRVIIGNPTPDGVITISHKDVDENIVDVFTINQEDFLDATVMAFIYELADLAQSF